jgi:hypothetical protein
MENKTSKYFKYAVGEILLVVIGILIALQINNWNSNRIQNKKEAKFIKQIHEEFSLNKKQLEQVSYHHYQGYKYGKKIVSLLPIDINTVNLDSLSYYLEETFYTWTFNPRQSSINALTSTASFDIISNVELRTILQSWNELVLDYKEEEVKTASFKITSYIPYLREKLALLNYKSSKNMFNHSKVDLSFLNDLKFENLISGVVVNSEDIVNPQTGNELEDVKNAIYKIIELTSSKQND